MHSFTELLKFIWRSTKRIVVFAVGVSLIALGVVMLVVPGPGLLVIVVGLAVLATEFVWAEVMLDKAKERAKQAGGAAKQGLSKFRRRKPEPADPTA